MLLLASTAFLEYRPIYNFEVVAPETPFGYGGLLASPTGAKGRMLVWGWMPEFYVWSGWQPATRDAHTYNEIYPSPNRDFFRRRMMIELQANPPEYVVDAVAPGSFGFTDASEDGIASFAELSDFVAQRYVQINLDPASGCPRVYARNDVAKSLGDRYIMPTSITSPLAGASTAAELRRTMSQTEMCLRSVLTHGCCQLKHRAKSS